MRNDKFKNEERYLVLSPLIQIVCLPLYCNRADGLFFRSVSSQHLWTTHLCYFSLYYFLTPFCIATWCYFGLRFGFFLLLCCVHNCTRTTLLCDASQCFQLLCSCHMRGPKFHRRTDGHAGWLLGERSFSTDSAVQLYMQTAKVFIFLRNLYFYQVWKKR